MHATGGDGGDVNDDAALLLDHRRQHGAAAPQGGEQRAAHFGLDLGFFVELEGLGPDGAADVVDQHVDTLELAQGLGNHGLGAGEGFEVGLEGCSLALGGLDLLDDFIDQVGTVDGQHLAAFGRNLHRDAPADALGGAGHDDDFFLEASGVAHSWAPAVEDENFSKWKLFGVTPTPDIHLRTPSTIGGGPQT